MGSGTSHIEEIKLDVKKQNVILEGFHTQHLETNKLILECLKLIHKNKQNITKTNEKIREIENYYEECREDIELLKDKHDKTEKHKTKVLSALEVLNKNI